MRTKLIVWGTVLACIAALGFQGATAARRVVEVTGTVEVSNLPLDEAGNVRVSGQGAGGPATATIELRFLDSERGPSFGTALFKFLPPIQLPAGFRTVSVGVQTLDARKAFILRNTTPVAVEFGSQSAPMVIGTNGEEFTIFWRANKLGVPTELNQILKISTYFVGGDLLQVGFEARSTFSTDPPPPDAEYLVHLYLAR